MTAPSDNGITSADEARAVAHEYAILSEALKETRARQAMLRQQLLDYMGTEGLSLVTDSQNQYALLRQMRTGRTSYDVSAMPPALVLAINSFGALRVDASASRTVLPTIRGQMEAYATVSDPTFALLVSRTP